MKNKNGIKWLVLCLKTQKYWCKYFKWMRISIHSSKNKTSYLEVDNKMGKIRVSFKTEKLHKSLILCIWTDNKVLQEQLVIIFKAITQKFHLKRRLRKIYIKIIQECSKIIIDSKNNKSRSKIKLIRIMSITSFYLQ